MSVWTEFFGEQLLTSKKGLQSTAEHLGDKKVVGIYFSAHWCPPCRAFTPALATLYDDMVAQHPDLEIVFVSSDSDADAFRAYHGEMPWAALPFENRDCKKALSDKYGVRGIPTLVFVDAQGQLITDSGRQLVYESQGDVDAMWAKLGQ